MPMISYAQNFEDVMLERVFKGKSDGFYIDLGAMDPVTDSVSKHFYDKGWHGINVEPVEKYYRRLVEARPRDTNLNVAVGDREGVFPFYQVHDTGLSTLSAEPLERFRSQGFRVEEAQIETVTLRAILREYTKDDIDFLKIDVEGSELAVLRGADWTIHRPKVVLVEAVNSISTTPAWDVWEPILLGNGYLFAYFDGLNRFYIRDENAEYLEVLSIPPNVFDDFLQYRCMRAWHMLSHGERSRVALHDAVRPFRPLAERTEWCHGHRLWRRQGQGGSWMARYPKQVAGLELSPTDDGFIIHEEARDRVHYLNPTAAAVLQLCDGATSGHEIARVLQQHFGLPEPPADEVSRTLEQFAEEGLIEPAPERT